MGRKIPGRKHKGVKDPDKQRAEKFKLIKDKVNAPPLNPDEQPISKSLQNLIELRKKVALKKNKKNVTKIKSDDKNKKNIKLKKGLKRLKPKAERPIKPAANFARLPGESDRSFLGRVNSTVRDFLREAEFENKFGVDIIRDKKTGDIKRVEKRPKDELDELIKKSKKKNKKKKKVNDSEPKLTKTQKRTKKLAEKKEKKELARIDEFSKYQDQVKFGEIAHAPPSLTVPKKIAQKAPQVGPRPGQKPLLLKQTINKIPSSEPHSKLSLKKSNVDVINKKGKRKDLPIAVRRQLETVQHEVMKAYRNLKKM